jgi:hypothetical protein
MIEGATLDSAMIGELERAGAESSAITLQPLPHAAAPSSATKRRRISASGC